MSEKVERCKFFLQTGISTKIVPYYKECKVCPLINKNGDCMSDIAEKHGSEMSEEIGEIWRDYFEKRGSQNGTKTGQVND